MLIQTVTSTLNMAKQHLDEATKCGNTKQARRVRGEIQSLEIQLSILKDLKKI